MPEVLKCSNCGASISPGQERCNFCGLFFEAERNPNGDEEADWDQHLAEETRKLELQAEAFQPLIYEGYTITLELDKDSATLFFWGQKEGGTLNFEGNSLAQIQKKIDHYEKSGARRQAMIRAYNRSGVY